MKSTLKRLLFSFIIAFVSCVILIGIIVDSITIQLVLGAMFSLITALLLIDFICCISDTVTYFTKPKRKKKMKTSETNKTEIRLQVKFVSKHTLHPKDSIIFVSKKNLVYCVTEAIKFAKESNCLIDEMELVTAEN